MIEKAIVHGSTLRSLEKECNTSSGFRLQEKAGNKIQIVLYHFSCIA